MVKFEEFYYETDYLFKKYLNEGKIPLNDLSKFAKYFNMNSVDDIKVNYNSCKELFDFLNAL